MKSVVYFVADDAGRIKIGTSTKIERRMKALQTAAAKPLRLLGVSPGAQELERRLHDEWSQHRLAGEWFAAAPEILAFISENAEPFEYPVKRERKSRAQTSEYEREQTAAMKQRIVGFLRAKYPTSTAAMVAADLGCSRERVEKWLELKAAPKGAQCFQMVEVYGPDFLEIWLGNLAPPWATRLIENARSTGEWASAR